VGTPSRKGARRHRKKKAITDGPFGETKDLVGGYLLVTAANLDAATELARGCPIFESETGSVEVREVSGNADVTTPEPTTTTTEVEHLSAGGGADVGRRGAARGLRPPGPAEDIVHDALVRR